MPEFSEVADGLSMPLADAMRTQRAVRRLRAEPVDDETLLAVLELATRAPTGSNAQGWEFIAVRDPDVKHALARLNRQAFSIYRRRMKGKVRGDLKGARMLAAVSYQADHFEDSPVIVVACLHGHPGPIRLSQGSFYASIYPAVQNLLLAARSLGLGATLTTLPLWSQTQARRTLGLPRGVTACAVIPLGWPQRGGYGPTTRRPVQEVLHLDHYGNRVFRDPSGVPPEHHTEPA
jgi:nitroreductase